MKRIVLIIEYDGTNYVGWQIQPNGIAVQQVIGNALKKITGENLTLHASGRTDSGVHARAQAAHFDMQIWRFWRMAMELTSCRLLHLH